MATCRDCGEEIWWRLTAGGKNMPVDSEDPEVFHIRQGSAWERATLPQLRILLENGELMHGIRCKPTDNRTLRVGGYLVHFDTCPHGR